MIALLYIHALRCREWLGLNAAETLITRSKIVFWLIPVGTGLAGVLIALFAADDGVIFAGYIYCTLFVLLPAHKVLERRRLHALQISTQAAT
jgi:uncharacterized membrane protein